MTSNVGSDIINKMRTFGFQGERKEEDALSESEMRSRVLTCLREQFKPEFLNRIDDIIIFHPLTKNILRKIVDIQINSVQKRLAERNIKLRVSNEVRSYLAERGYDPMYGARPLKRMVQNEISDKLALEILEKKIADGDVADVSLKDGKIVFQKNSQ